MHVYVYLVGIFGDAFRGQELHSGNHQDLTSDHAVYDRLAFHAADAIDGVGLVLLGNCALHEIANAFDFGRPRAPFHAFHLEHALATCDRDRLPLDGDDVFSAASCRAECQYEHPRQEGPSKTLEIPAASLHDDHD
jgi:hypothetical protein